MRHSSALFGGGVSQNNSHDAFSVGEKAVVCSALQAKANLPLNLALTTPLKEGLFCIIFSSSTMLSDSNWRNAQKNDCQFVI